ncbi:MAG: hypothetical protein DWQ08_01665 [Proteobacteria bacterium]|nr:MAG: hypothetical protein DWQ08_01665 [Pseudomonadota bacterium]
MSKKRITLALASLGAMLSFTSGALAADRIAFGTTALKSVHYTYAAAAGKAINEHSADKVQLTVISTGGAVDNLNRIGRGHIDMELGTDATIYQA